MLTTVELFEYLKVEKRLRVTREREVANALELAWCKISESKYQLQQLQIEQQFGS
jgi:hypothetical protein